ncbi:ATP-binding cassette domain-containing protein [Pseudomonas akapageensis]|uniref:ATP-binding cassette domain-containing protein n=1 Tax=Pseudomonas akapageensis TaxID=2609961 RepID=UPI0015B65D65
MLQISGLHKAYGDSKILRGVDLTVQRGEVIFLIGPSGGGKSTLLRCINFLETPCAGEITFTGERLCHQDNQIYQQVDESRLRMARSKMPMVFQQFNLFSNRTVLENVIEGPVHVLRRPRQEAIAEARVILDKVGLSARLDYYPDQLSGGQRQRVAIARALAMKPELILFDEPTSALDPELVSGVLDTIRQLAQEGMTMIIVTHEMNFARKLADRICFVADGGILESGSPEQLLATPARNSRIASFIQSMQH